VKAEDWRECNFNSTVSSHRLNEALHVLIRACVIRRSEDKSQVATSIMLNAVLPLALQLSPNVANIGGGIACAIEWYFIKGRVLVLLELKSLERLWFVLRFSYRALINR
jgi:hypothetical protein